MKLAEQRYYEEVSAYDMAAASVKTASPEQAEFLPSSYGQSLGLEPGGLVPDGENRNASSLDRNAPPSLSAFVGVAF